MSWATHPIGELREGRAVEFRPRGNSMTPRIKSGQLCRVEPIKEPVARGDVVLAKVRGTPYLHLVSGVREGQVQISNNHGHVNGWTALTNVYGLLTQVSP